MTSLSNATRVVGALVALNLLGAASVLYLFPSDTERLFSWTIQPPLTALFLGAGYGGGAYLFARMALDPRWPRYEAALPGIWAFTALVFAATLMHLDRFHHGHIVFYVWVVGYGVLPFVLPVLWSLQARVAPPEPAQPDRAVPAAVRLATALLGAGSLALGLALFIAPEAVSTVWPWDLTPLTGRVVGSAYVLAGGLGVGLSRRRDWERWRAPVASQLISYVLLLLALPRAWNDLHTENPLAWVLVIVTVAAIFALGALTYYMEVRRRAPHS